jgi:hypothetical protein
MRNALFATLLTCGLAAFAQQPNQKEHDHHQAVNQRGDQVMGFSHDEIKHHFRLYSDGGAIEVETIDPNYTDSRDQIRSHLRHISQMFAAGDFNAPMLIHDQTPPGVPVLQRLKSKVVYDFENSDNGAAIQIRTKNPEALKAIYAFLRFQIADHQTGDTSGISRRP